MRRRHAELVSASNPEAAVRVEAWTLKQVQGDGGYRRTGFNSFVIPAKAGTSGRNARWSPRGSGFCRDDGRTQSARGAPKRNGGRHCCRPPLSLGPLVLPVKARPPFPGRFRPRPCGPGRSLRFLRRTIAGPVPVPAGSDPCLAAGLRFPGGFLPSRPCGFEIRFPIGRQRSKLRGRPFAVPSARGLQDPPDPRRKVGSALACAAASRFFLPVARTSFHSASVRRLKPLSAGPCLGAPVRFRMAAPCHRKDIGTRIRFAPSAESGTRPVDNGDNGDNMD
jgi:hypothetical protein